MSRQLSEEQRMLEEFDRELDIRMEEFGRKERERFAKVKETSDKIEEIATRIFIGESGLFMREVEKVGAELKREMGKIIKKSMKENKEAIRKIINDSILSGTRFNKDNVQYFKNRADFERSKKSLETELNEKMIRMIADKACAEFSKHR